MCRFLPRGPVVALLVDGVSVDVDELCGATPMGGGDLSLSLSTLAFLLPGRNRTRAPAPAGMSARPALDELLRQRRGVGLGDRAGREERGDAALSIEASLRRSFATCRIVRRELHNVTTQISVTTRKELAESCGCGSRRNGRSIGGQRFPLTCGGSPDQIDQHFPLIDDRSAVSSKLP